MSERYWISGADIGMIFALLEVGDKNTTIKKILDRIQEKQFIGNIKEGQKIVIK